MRAPVGRGSDCGCRAYLYSGGEAGAQLLALDRENSQRRRFLRQRERHGDDAADVAVEIRHLVERETSIEDAADEEVSFDLEEIQARGVAGLERRSMGELAFRVLPSHLGIELQPEKELLSVATLIKARSPPRSTCRNKPTR